MKILHISTSDIGGAAIAARGLNALLNVAGINSEFVALDRRGYLPQDFELIFSRKIWVRIRGRLLTFLQLSLNSKIFFSLFSSSSGIFELIKQYDSSTTVIHVHNWYNMLSLRDIRRIYRAGFKVVFTLHDQRLSTGGCHTPYNCEKFKLNCDNCPNLPIVLRKIPRRKRLKSAILFRSFQNSIVLIAPSKFIGIQFSPFLSIAKIHIEQIGNVLNFDLPFCDRRIRDGVVIGLASVSNSSYLKGGDILERISKIASEQSFKVTFRQLDSLSGNESYSAFWNSIDYLFLPSRYENSPNVIREAHFAGIPVIASDVGGIRELVDPSTDFLFDPFSQIGFQSLIDYIELISKVSKNRDRRMSHQEVNQNQLNLKQHINLYRSFFEQRP